MTAAALPSPGRPHRLVRRIAAVVLAAGVLLGIDAAPAFAHAELLSASPSPGAVLRAAPAQVLLTYDEAVQAETNAIEVVTAAGRDLAIGPSHHPGGRGDQVAAALPRDLHGTYIATWRVISADTHPVQGAFSFSVGSPSVGGPTGGLEARALAGRRGDDTVAALQGVNRFATLAAVIAFAGAVALIAGAWPSGADDRRARRYLQVTAGAVALFALTGIALQGVYGAGRPLGDLLTGRYLSPAFHSRFGYASLVRAALAVGAVGLRPLRRRPLPYAVGNGLAALAVVVTVSISGHAVTGRWQPVALLVDVVHVTAAAAWIGALGLLAVAVLGPRRPPLALDATAGTVRRYSTMASAALAVVIASGVVQAWRQVGSWHALSSTNYGHLLLLKVVAVVAVAYAGWLSRRWIRQHLEAATADAGRPGHPGLGPFRRWVTFEVALGAIVVVVTSFLVNAAPPQTTADATAARTPQPFSATINDGPYQLAVAVGPGATGPNEINLSLTDAEGVARDPFQIYVQLNLPARHLGPIAVPLRQVRTGAWTATTTITLPGTWQLYVGLLTSPTDEIDKTLDFQVAG